MPKLAKNMYTTAKGERKLNCYVVNIPKEVVEKTNLKDVDLKISSKDNKIIIGKTYTNESFFVSFYFFHFFAV